MYTRVFAIGRPICGANGSPRFISTQVEYVVVSDGPYRLHTLSTSVVAKIRSTNDFFSGSPARFTARTVEGTWLPSASTLIADGTVLIKVTSSGRFASSSALGTIL